jgi:hypothetical protein
VWRPHSPAAGPERGESASEPGINLSEFEVVPGKAIVATKAWSRAPHGNLILSVMAFRRQSVRSYRLARWLTGFLVTFTVETVRSVHVPSTATPSGGDLLGKANGPSVFGAHLGA